MANTIVLGKNNQTITIADIDTNWLWSDTISSTTWPKGLSLWSIKFTPAVAGDKCILTDEGGETSIEAFEVTCRDVYDDKIEYFPPDHTYQLKLTVASGSYNAGAKLRITLRP